MKLLPILIGLTIALIIFALMWRQGAFMKLSAYFDETKEELRKCTWPSWSELGQSTVVVLVAIAGLGLFTFVADRLITFVISRIV